MEVCDSEGDLKGKGLRFSDKKGVCLNKTTTCCYIQMALITVSFRYFFEAKVLYEKT